MSKTAKRFCLGAILAIAATCVLLFVTARSFAGKFEPEVRRRVVQYLEQRFDSDVSLAELKIRLPKVSLLGLLFSGGHGTTAHVSGKKLTLRYRNSVAGDPPLFAVDSFSFDLDLGMLAQPHPRIPHLLLEGMSIAISHRGDKPDGPKTVGHSSNSNLASTVIIDKIDISHARLLILPKKADAKPLDFGLDSIQLASAGIGSQLHYQAVLMNPRPPGKIRATGAFGPWNSDAPGDTPLDGDYDFSNANLDVFPAIAGILHSSGHFVGTLSAVRARGEATVPDFRLTASGNRVPLETQYDVLVDGTNGNTVLQPVHARLGNTEFVTSGGIIKHEEGGRRAINLDVSMPHGHIEDLLLLSVKGKPFMSGLIQMNAKISIPPLGGSVKDKLHLEGTFDIAKGEFLRDAVQDKVDELSRRGQGKPGDSNVDNVFSRMTGTFQMEDQVLTFKRLSFEVPGATVGLHGDYRMARDTLDFHGSLRLKAKISETLSGWKHWLAKPIDPFFAKNGAGTFLKIQVVGSASKPEFGRDHGEGQ